MTDIVMSDERRGASRGSVSPGATHRGAHAVLGRVLINATTWPIVLDYSRASQSFLLRV